MRIQRGVSAGAETSGVIQAVCPEAVQVGDVVWASDVKVGSLFSVSVVNIDGTLREAMGFGVVSRKRDATQCEVHVCGILSDAVTGLGALQPGSLIFVSHTGRLRTGPPARPTSDHRYWQNVGYALSESDVLLAFHLPTKVKPLG
jgi:hypothetical protein